MQPAPNFRPQLVDFFCGLGGASQGAVQAGYEVVLAANHDHDAITWHQHNHMESEHWVQDLQQCDMSLVPDHDVLFAGIACQGHSQNAQPARKGTGGSHSPNMEKAIERSRVNRATAWAVTELAEVKRPAAIVVENVPDMMDWVLFPCWLTTLRELGYKIASGVLDALCFGVPQDRQRLIVVAYERTLIDAEPGMPKPTVDFDRAMSSCIQHDSADNRWTWIDDKSERMRTRMRKAQEKAGPRCFWNNVSEARGRDLCVDPFPTLTTKSGSQFYLLDGDRCRILNPRELARAQGFPESYDLPPTRELCSRLIGNAIPVPLAEAVLRKVREDLNQ